MNGGFPVAFLVVSLAAAGLLACEDKSSGTGTAGSATASATASVSALAASASASAVQAQTATADAAVNAVPAASSAAAAGSAPTTEATAASATPSASASAKTFACGGKVNPCPLEAWMKKNAQPAVASGDAADLAKALEAMVKFAPPGYPTWASIATAGATAAKGGDIAGAKASCKNCHDAYKKKYVAEIRDRKI